MMKGKGIPSMKNRRNLLLCGLVLIGSIVACGLWFAGETWAWPTVSEKSRQQLTLGTVDHVVRIRQEEQELSLSEPLESGSYTVQITATGDAEGWFCIWIFPYGGDTESACYRTAQLKPDQTLRFELELEEPAFLKVESRWDIPRGELAMISEGAQICWGIPTEDLSETEPETEATEPETEETEPETEATEPETEATEPETEETEPTEAETESDENAE